MIYITWYYSLDEYYDTAKLNQGNPTIPNPLGIPGFFAQVGKQVIESMQSLVPVDTGYLKSTIFYWNSGYWNNHMSGGVGAGAKYAGAVNAGSRPHMPPLLYLPGWALRHWGNLGPDTVVKAGQYLQQYIAKYGTKARPFIEAGISEANAIKPPYGFLTVTYDPK